MRRLGEPASFYTDERGQAGGSRRVGPFQERREARSVVDRRDSAAIGPQGGCEDVAPDRERVVDSGSSDDGATDFVDFSSLLSAGSS